MNPSITYKLNNGLNVVIAINKEIESVSMQLIGLAGSNYESPTQIGAAHLVEHLLLSKNNNEILNTGGKVVGVTSRDSVLYGVKIIKNHQKKALNYLSKIFDEKNLDASLFEKVRIGLLPEITRQYDKPEKIVTWGAYAKMYKGTRLSIPNIGGVKYLDLLTEEKMRDFYRNNYSNDRFVLSICGNVTPNKIIDDIKYYFNQTPSHVTPYKKLKLKTGYKNINFPITSSFTQKYLNHSYKGVLTGDKNVNASILLAKIFDIVLKNSANKLGISYKTSVDSFSSLNYSLFSFFGECHEKNIDALQKLFTYLTTHTEKVLTEQNLNLAKTKVMSENLFQLEKPYLRAIKNAESILFNQAIMSIQSENKLIKQIGLEEVKCLSQNMFKSTPIVSVV